MIGRGDGLCLTFVTVYLFRATIRMFFPCLLVCLRRDLKFGVRSLLNCMAGPILVTTPFMVVTLITMVILINGLVSGVNGGVLLFITVTLFAIKLFTTSFVRATNGFTLTTVPLFTKCNLLKVVLGSAMHSCAPRSGANLFRKVEVVFFILVPVVMNPSVNSQIYGTCTNKACINSSKLSGCRPYTRVFLTTTVITLLILVPYVVLHGGKVGGGTSVGGWILVEELVGVGGGLTVRLETRSRNFFAIGQHYIRAKRCTVVPGWFCGVPFYPFWLLCYHPGGRQREQFRQRERLFCRLQGLHPTLWSIYPHPLV